MLFVQLEQRHALHIAKRFIRRLQGRLLHGVRRNRFVPVDIHQIAHLLGLAQRAVIAQRIEFFQLVHLGAHIRDDRQDIVLGVFDADLRISNHGFAPLQQPDRSQSASSATRWQNP